MTSKELWFNPKIPIGLGQPFIWMGRKFSFGSNDIALTDR